MAKKNYDSLVSSILGGNDNKKVNTPSKTVQPAAPVKDIVEEEASKAKPVLRKICTKMTIELHEKLKVIAQKEDIDIKDIIELGCSQLVSKYEEKHGKIRVSINPHGKAKKDVGDIFS